MSDENQRWSKYLFALSIFLFIKAFIIILLILFAGIGLGPDEAQYWTWSQFLDWGYYSKPPGIAWQIWSGTLLFGNSELGVRFFSIILGFCFCLSIFFLAKSCRVQPKTAFLASVAMALTPLGMLGSFFAITDVGMIFFWTLSCIVLTSSLASSKTPNYYLLGFLILCGALFKWPIYLFWVLVILFMFMYRFLKSTHAISGIVISLAGLVPSAYWNFFHEWATFRHVAATAAGGNESQISHGNLGEFLGAQAGLISPILFILLILSFAFLIKNRKRIHPSLIFCGITSLLILLFFSTLALFQKIQGNWGAFAYPTAIVFLTWYACEKSNNQRWLIGGIGLSMIISIAAFAIPYLQSHNIGSNMPIPYKFNPFRHNVGWDRLHNVLEEIGYDAEEEFLFGDKYQTSSILSFYSPGQKRAYFLNLHGIRKNQFSFWPSMKQEQTNRSGYFILTENAPHLENPLNEKLKFYDSTLKKYFKKVEFVGIFPLFESYGEVAKAAIIYKGIEYNGLEPNSLETY